MCPHNGRILILLVTPRGEDPRIDESPMEYVGPFNAEVPLSDDLLTTMWDNLEDSDGHEPPRGYLDDAFAAL